MKNSWNRSNRGQTVRFWEPWLVLKVRTVPFFYNIWSENRSQSIKNLNIKKTNCEREKNKTKSQVGEVANITVNFLVVYLSDHPHLLFSSSPSRQHFAQQAVAINSSPHIDSCFLFLSSALISNNLYNCILVFVKCAHCFAWQNHYHMTSWSSID